MSERCVEIPVRRDIRDTLKEKKGHMTYNEYFAMILDL